MHHAILSSHKVQKHQEAKCDKAAHNNSIPPLLRADPPNQTIQSRYLTGSSSDPSIDTGQRFSL